MCGTFRSISSGMKFGTADFTKGCLLKRWAWPTLRRSFNNISKAINLYPGALAPRPDPILGSGIHTKFAILNSQECEEQRRNNGATVVNWIAHWEHNRTTKTITTLENNIRGLWRECQQCNSASGWRALGSQVVPNASVMLWDIKNQWPWDILNQSNVLRKHSLKKRKTAMVSCSFIKLRMGFRRELSIISLVEWLPTPHFQRVVCRPALSSWSGTVTSSPTRLAIYWQPEKDICKCIRDKCMQFASRSQISLPNFLFLLSK